MLRRLLLPLAFALAGCASASDADVDDKNDAFSSANATLVDFDFRGEVEMATPSNVKGRIRAQLMYTVGQLNVERSVARLGHMKLTVDPVPPIAKDGVYRVGYRAQVQVAWGNGAPPDAYDLVLPRRVDDASVKAFTQSYGIEAGCTKEQGHDLGPTNYWWYFRPQGCPLAASHVVRTRAKVTKSALDSDVTYPEYDRVWEDGSLDVVAVFGKSAPFENEPGDYGVTSYQDFVRKAETELHARVVRSAKGTDVVADTTLEAKLEGGRTLTITALLVEEVRSVGPAFDKRYAEVVTGADLVLYNGHAGLGTNVAALTKKGTFLPGKYQVFVLNGCDTFAYEDDTLAREHAAVNPDDPLGTKTVDVVTNVMPGDFTVNADLSVMLVTMLLEPEKPRTYASTFARINASQIIAVTGDEDNRFRPGRAIARAATFAASGSVQKNEVEPHVTAPLAAGRYAFTLAPSSTSAGGDADLRVRIGSEPEDTDRCKSYRFNSNELCVIDVPAGARAYMTVTGDKTGVDSGYSLRVFPMK